MFIGHFAVGFGAKRAAPSVSLGTLFLACQLLDLVWPLLVLLGIEVVELAPGITAVTPLDFTFYPYSHSLVASVLWAFLFAAAYWLLNRPTLRAPATLAAVVFSHWLLDVVSHRPDMPITLSGESKVGLGLWHSVPATLVVESALFFSGVYLYVRSTQARNRTGSYAFWALLAFLLIVYALNFFSSPPPSGEAVAGAALAMWLLVAWGYWVDHNRQPVTD
jgi:membrane-bound metal-dependent hydrolase YbcI (DUF457 family)